AAERSLQQLDLPMSSKAIPPDLARSPVFDHDKLVRSRVTHANSAWTLALGIGFALVLGLMSFGALYAGRQHGTKPAVSPVVSVRPPPRVASLPMQAQILPPPSAAVSKPTQIADLMTRLHAPAVVVDLSEPSASAAAAATAAASSTSGDEKLSPDERFAVRMHSNAVETSHATKLRNVSQLAPQGTVIPAVLETAIDSDLPGSVRAVVSRDVRGFDGTRVLIPRGSKLVGEYRSGISLEHSRAFVIWSRILTPEGVSIAVGSPGTD